MTYEENKIIDEINRLYAAGYDSNYPPLSKLLESYESIIAREERWARLNECSCE